ncbi:hypothetical protein MTO96_031053 [Rhipicephalus appendiculatus]
MKIINDDERVQCRLREYEPEALMQLNTGLHQSPAQDRPLPRVFTPSTEPRPRQLDEPSSTCQHYNRPPHSATGCPYCGYYMLLLRTAPHAAKFATSVPRGDTLPRCLAVDPSRDLRTARFTAILR